MLQEISEYIVKSTNLLRQSLKVMDGPRGLPATRITVDANPDTAKLERHAFESKGNPHISRSLSPYSLPLHTQGRERGLSFLCSLFSS